MYCMTNVLKFQQQYLNWQILDWTKIDDTHIKIHLQSPADPVKHVHSPAVTKADPVEAVSDGREPAGPSHNDSALNRSPPHKRQSHHLHTQVCTDIIQSLRNGK